MNEHFINRERIIFRIKSSKHYLSAIVIAAIWLSIILFYTRGGLLVGGDQPGLYNALSSISTLYPNYVIPGIGLLLANGNIYVGFYLGLFIGLCINLIALSYFLSTLFVEWRGKMVPLVIASLLFVFGMFTIYDTFESVIGVASVSGAGMFLFLAEAVKLYRHMNNKSNGFGKINCVLMGIGIAVSSTIPPNSFRLIAIEVITLLGLLILSVIQQGAVKISNVKFVAKRFVVALPLIILVAIAGMMYWEWYFFSSFKTNVGTSLQAAQSLGLFTLNAPYATLINTFRIFGVWAFETGYVPYHGLYYSNPLVTSASFMWPIAALGMSLLLVEKSNRSKILLLVTVSLVIIAWDTANNPPVGAINLFAVSHIQLLSSLFQTYFLSGTLLPIIYVALSTFVVVRLIESLHSSKKFFHFRYKKLLMIIPILLIVLLLVADMPFFTGAALGEYFNPSIKGIWVPNDYFKVKNVLSSSMQSGNTALLWPSISTYVQTSWGYQGANSFYNNFFVPSLVLTPASFGGYSLANPSLAAEYSTLTSVPVMAGKSTDITNYTDYAKLSVQGASCIYSNNTISLGSVDGSLNNVTITIPFHESFNASNCLLFTLQFSANPESLISSMLKDEGLWIGIGYSDGETGWYIPGSSTSSNYTVNNNIVTISMVANSPDNPWTAPAYNASIVSDIAFSLSTKDLTNSYYPSLDLSSITIQASSTEVNESLINLWQQYKVEYVIFDSSNISGSLISPEQYSASLSFLINKGLLAPVFVGKYLQLYRVNYEAPL